MLARGPVRVSGIPLLLVIALAAHAAPTPVAGDIRMDSSPTGLVFGNEALELRFDGTTGELRQIVYRPKNLALLDNTDSRAGCDLCLKNVWLSGTGASPWRYGRHEVEKLPNGAALHITASLNGWRLRATYRLWPRKAALLRSAAFTPAPGASGRVSGLRLLLPGLKLTDPASTVYAQLSNFPPAKTSWAELTPGHVVDEQNAWVSGHFVLLHDAKAGLSVPVTYFSDREYSSAHVIEGRGAITVLGHQQAIVDVQPGQEIAYGSQLLCVAEGDWHVGLRAAQGLFDLVGFTPPERTRELAAKTVMYSAHAGGTIDSGFRDVGGFRAFTKLLPHLQDLGVNLLWLLPTWHGSVYAPDDYSRLDPSLGTEEDLKALVDQAHGLGIRVLLDLIPHGPLDSSKLHEQHPDWICKNEDGSFQYWWGCLYADYAHPGWQQFMADHATDWVRRVGVDGYRVDCAGGGPPNWRPYGDNRPSMSGLYGGLKVLAAARQEMETVKPEIFLLAEAGGPPFFRSADFTYNWAFAFGVLPDLMRGAGGAARWVPEAEEWLERQQFTFPRGARQIMFLENHDTARAIMQFGVGTQRALLALCAFSGGTPFLYHDQEIGYGPYPKKLYAIRAAYDELALGEVSYTAIAASDPAVFTILHSYQGRNTVVAINFTPGAPACTLDLSGCPGLGPQVRYSLWDAFHEVSLNAAKPQGLLPSEMRNVAVPQTEAYAPAVIVIRPAREGASPVAVAKPRGAGGTPRGTKPSVTREGNRVTVDNGICWLQVSPETGGLIESLATAGHDPQPLLGRMSFGTLQRHLWLGGDLKLGPETLKTVEVVNRDGQVATIARGLVSRTIGGVAEPALDYEARLVVDDSPDIKFLCSVTPRMNIFEVLGSLATTLSFPGADRWAAHTVEGLLYDDLVPRRSADLPLQSLYAHPHSDRLYASDTIPLDPANGFIGAEWPDGRYVLVRDIKGWTAGVPQQVMVKERLGDALGLHGVIAWATGRKPLTLNKGQSHGLSLTLSVGFRGETGLREATRRGVESGPVNLRAEGARYVVRTPLYRADFLRSAGGSIEHLQLNGVGGTALGGSNVYSDYGLYPDWTDPSGSKIKTNASANADIEPEVTIDRQPDRLALTFAGFLRQPNTFGRGIAGPPTDYRVTYGFSTGPAVEVECAVRPRVARAQVKAFLAQTLALPDAGPWAVYTGREPRLVAAGRPPGPGDRVWQSAGRHIQDADEPRLLVEAPAKPGGRLCAEFSDFKGLEEVQNLFYLQGRTDAVLFAAFLDGQPEDLRPRWRTVRYRIALHAGTLGEVTKQLQLPAPKG